MEGLIIRSLGGFYTVESGDGTRTECRGRGIFRKDATTLLVGDRCTFEPTEPGCGSITAIAPRKNILQRPPVANLDRLALVVSLADPAPNALVLDQLTAIAARKSIPVVLIFTKPDLVDPAPWTAIYQKAGYPTAVVNNRTGEGAEDAARLLRGGITAFCGNSGAGKSSLLNTLYPALRLATGEISKKLGRGRHTTRHVELFGDGDEGYLCDTPGFSALEFARSEPMPASELAACFPEMARYAGGCRYTGCSHRTEQGCAVREAVAMGEIPESRHRSYVTIYNELKQLKEWELAKTGRP